MAWSSLQLAQTGRGRKLWASSIEGRCCYQSPCLEYGEQNQELVEGLHETSLDRQPGQELKQVDQTRGHSEEHVGEGQDVEDGHQ